MDKCAIVTGATGFIGSRLCAYLAKGGWKVYAIVRPRANQSGYGLAQGVDGYHVYAGDVHSLAHYLEVNRPDVVFHLAAHYVADHQPEDIPVLVAGNISFGAAILDAMRLASVKTFVGAGTSWQECIAEDVSYNPANLYAATKQAFEDILAYYARSTDMRCAILRIFDSYAEDDLRGKLISVLFQRLKTGEKIELSPGDQEMDLVHVDDICGAFVECYHYLQDTERSGSCHVFGLSSGERRTVRQLVELLEHVSGKTLNAQWGVKPYRKCEVMRLQTGYRSLPRWQPKIQLEEGLRRLWEELSDHERK
ncbi:MAG: NAD(P)-dependent oxidoreductase [Planctomycetaceae bacterium]|nr:NAD(P)-dependent oxidoreductase [Planctomycetaceae bacterium]